MCRIAPSTAFASIPLDDLGQGDRINLGVASILGHRPEVANAVGALRAALQSSGSLSPRLVELVRLRFAFHNQCRSCMFVRYQSAIDDGLTEDLVCSLEKPAEAEDLTSAERSALRFADLFATDPPVDRRRGVRRSAPTLHRGRTRRTRCALRLRGGHGSARGDVERHRRCSRRVPVDAGFTCGAVGFRRRRRIRLDARR